MSILLRFDVVGEGPSCIKKKKKKKKKKKEGLMLVIKMNILQ